MDKRIVFLAEDGTVGVVIPTDAAAEKWGVEAIAKKDVPVGRPYKIVDAADVPSDRMFRAAWSVDAAALTDGVGTGEAFPPDPEPVPAEPAVQAQPEVEEPAL